MDTAILNRRSYEELKRYHERFVEFVKGHAVMYPETFLQVRSLRCRAPARAILKWRLQRLAQRVAEIAEVLSSSKWLRNLDVLFITEEIARWYALFRALSLPDRVGDRLLNHF